jgi:hypothetical protein
VGVDFQSRVWYSPIIAKEVEMPEYPDGMYMQEKPADAFARAVHGRDRFGEACVTCGSELMKREDFRDELSWKERGISGMCQACQDSVFSGGDEEDD